MTSEELREAVMQAHEAHLAAKKSFDLLRDMLTRETGLTVKGSEASSIGDANLVDRVSALEQAVHEISKDIAKLRHQKVSIRELKQLSEHVDALMKDVTFLDEVRRRDIKYAIGSYHEDKAGSCGFHHGPFDELSRATALTGAEGQFVFRLGPSPNEQVPIYKWDYRRCCWGAVAS